MDDGAIPNDTWSKEAVELFNQLNEIGGDWKKLFRNISIAPDGSRSFLDSEVKRGKLFNYAFFYNGKQLWLKGVVEFKLYCRGPVGHVHGGAIATVLDSAMGSCSSQSGLASFTGNLNVDFKRPLPLNTTTLVEAKVDKIDGRKVFLSATIKSMDGSQLYSKGTAIFIKRKLNSSL